MVTKGLIKEWKENRNILGILFDLCLDISYLYKDFIMYIHAGKKATIKDYIIFLICMILGCIAGLVVISFYQIRLA